MKKLLASAVILTVGFMATGSAFAQPVPIRLFDATKTFETVFPNVPPSDAFLFPFPAPASTTVTLNIQPGDTYVISSTEDGAGPIVIDNFMTINRMVNVCESVSGQESPDSCFGPILDESLPVGEPIENVLTPVGPIDVTHIFSALPRGRNDVVFELRDFGTIAGNTDLFLVIAGPGGGSPAGGRAPVVPPIDPDVPAELQAGVQCGFEGAEGLVAIVTNVGGQPSDPTRASIVLERRTGEDSQTLLNERPNVDRLDPGEPDLLTIIPTDGCPPFTLEEDRCDLFIRVGNSQITSTVEQDSCRF